MQRRIYLHHVLLILLKIMVEGAFDAALHGLADRLAQSLGNDALATSTLRVVRERAPDERLALAFLLRLAESSSAGLADLLRDPTWASDLIFCLGGSELIGAGLSTMDSEWVSFFSDARAPVMTALLESIRFDGVAANDRHEVARILGDWKARAFIRIAIGDLLGRLSVTDTMTAMSHLADECIRGALDAALRLLPAQAGPAGEFCVLAMGKLGAGELNLSSDIDLMYLFAGPGNLTHQETARHLGELLTEILSAHCFRVDLRLRPGGRNSPLVVSFEGALNFYQSLGQTWERAALLRARPVAGAVHLGHRLISELGRFIYRSYLDFDTLRQLRAMKRQIEEELHSSELVRRNIKLGYGGIRELEFIVQALALIYGGRDRRLRTARTLTALERLEVLGYMAPERARNLRAAYLFLRNVEHKLQVAAGLQTHTLPADAAALNVTAARLGFGKNPDAAAGFAQTLDAHRNLVATQFREMLAGGEQRSGTAASAAAQSAWSTALEPARSAVALDQLGFARSDESAGHLLLLARGPAHAPASPRRREILDRLGPLLLDEMRALADPDLALMSFASFIAAVGARTSFLSLLEEHPATRRVLLRLFASSSHLSSLFIRHPDMLDTLVRSDLARLHRTTDELGAELSGLLRACEDFESQLDALRAFRHQEFLRIAIADLAGSLELEDVQSELTRLAETVVREALALARSEVSVRYPLPAGLRLCVVALGRLGAGEMSYNSDLDLIFIYHEADVIVGGRLEAASRIVQKLIAILESRTREGYAYKIDLRLRPSGNAGPLVASLDGFRDYHRQSAAIWERQSLVRARVMGGDSWLADEIEAARNEFVFAHGLDRAEIEEIRAMRDRMEHEIGVENSRRLNLKQGRGGLVDVDFLTQMMALAHGHEFPSLRRHGTIASIRALGDSTLIPPDEAGHLESDYRFLVRLENRLRIETDQAAWALPTAPDQLTPIARRMGYDGDDAAERLLEELEQRRSRIRATFAACFSREEQH
jgi:glutamate-ammonia-ligase adenylyltransferase